MQSANKFIFMIFMFSCAFTAHTAEEAYPHHDFPPAVTQFHNVMAPLWHSQAGETRAKNICNQYTDLAGRAENILSEQTPQGVNAQEWKEIAGKLQKDVYKIKSLCTDEMSPEQALADVHNTFHQLVRLVGHRH